MTQIRGIPRILIAVVLLVVISLLLLLSPISGEHGEKSRQIISSVVQKVQGDATKGAVDLAEEELRRWEYRRALVYEGTGARVHEFLDKARSGKPFTVSVVGGSVSKGRGLTPPAHLDNTNASSVLGATTLYSPENLHVLIFDWLNATFPHPENKLVNGAQGGVGSGYFSWCYKEHTADDSDLVLVELGINDLMDVNVFGSYEHFVRGVLEMAHKPAVINVETFTTLFPTLISSSSLHLDVAAFYDLPTVSIRDVLLPRLLANPHEEMPKWFRTGPTVQMGDNKVKEWGGTAVDLMHISSLGHALAAGLVIRYLSEQIEATKPSGTFGRLKPEYMKKKPLRITSFPPAALTIPYDPATGRIRHNPICRSMNSGKYHRPEGDIEAEAQRGIVVDPSTKGWSSWAWKEKIYLVGKEPGALLSVPFNVASLPINTVDKAADDLTSPSADGEDKSKLGFEPLPLAIRPGAPYNFYPVGVSVEVREGEVEKRQYPEQDGVEGGRVLIGYQQSATIGLGSVWCWVDDDKNEGKQINGWWQIQERNMGMVEEITSGLKSGPHVLHCEILEHTLDPKGGTEFRIFAVMHD